MTRGLTPISPPHVKYADLLRPVVLASPSAAAEAPWWRSPPSAVFVSGTGANQGPGTQHLLRLSLRVAECGRAGARGLETQSCPHTGLVMTGDVAEAHPLSPGSGEGPRHAGTRDRVARRGWTSHQAHVLPDQWFLIARGGRSARCGAIAGELGPDGST